MPSVSKQAPFALLMPQCNASKQGNPPLREQSVPWFTQVSLPFASNLVLYKQSIASTTFTSLYASKFGLHD